MQRTSGSHPESGSSVGETVKGRAVGPIIGLVGGLVVGVWFVGDMPLGLKDGSAIGAVGSPTVGSGVGEPS